MGAAKLTWEQERIINNAVVVIINPASGSVTPETRAALEQALATQAQPYSVLETTPSIGADALAKRAMQDGVALIIACGGDGTVKAVVNGLCSTRQQGHDCVLPTLAIVPVGTANLLAAALAIPNSIEEAVATALHGRDRRIDIGCCGDELFALGVGLGITEKLVSQASRREKDRFGKAAYALAMLRELGARPTQISFKLDGGSTQRAQGVAVVVANAGEVGGGLRFAPDAVMDDGLLDLVILHRFELGDLARLMWSGVTHTPFPNRLLSSHQAKRIELDCRPALKLQVDGETVEGRTPVTASLLPRQLCVRVPPVGNAAN